MSNKNLTIEKLNNGNFFQKSIEDSSKPWGKNRFKILKMCKNWLPFCTHSRIEFFVQNFVGKYLFVVKVNTLHLYIYFRIDHTKESSTFVVLCQFKTQRKRRINYKTVFRVATVCTCTEYIPKVSSIGVMTFTGRRTIVPWASSSASSVSCE